MKRKPYEIVGELKRFNRRNTAFARSKWTGNDGAEEGISRPREEILPSGAPGYTLEDFAFQVGSRAINNQFGETRQSQIKSLEVLAAERRNAGRYEPDSWERFTERVKQVGRQYGAALVGITRVNPLWVYATDGEDPAAALPDEIDTAIVIAVEMDYDLIGTSPAAPASGAAGTGYSQMAFTATSVASYLCELGWRAIPCGNHTAISIPLAIDAGLGELGRNGLLITKLYGPRVRLCKVLTDAPLVPDEPISFGVKEFCDACKKCADACPSRSISRDGMTDSGPTPSNNPGVLKWYINPDACLAFWRTNGISCCNCIRSCPFNKRLGRFHDVVRWFIKGRSHLLDRAMVLMDTLCGYGRQKDPERAWKKLPSP